MRTDGKLIRAITLVIVAITQVAAFVPDYPRAAFTSGDPHIAITQKALDEIYAVYGYTPDGADGIAYTSEIKRVRGIIPEKNAEVDHDKRMKKYPEYHCDGEQLNECSQLVIDKTNEGIEKIISSDLENARTLIGIATHTLQDFYAHSNWIELGNSGANPYMGFSAFPFGSIALPEEDTCDHPHLQELILAPSIEDYLAANQRLICDTNYLEPSFQATGKLTSGYYLGTSGYPANKNKCYHGGSFDALGILGINKDSATCRVALVISPHHDFNPAAERAAQNATVKYLLNIRDELKAKQGNEEGDRLFKSFLGIGPSLGFAIDTTGSMGEEIAGVKSAVASAVQARIGATDEPSSYALAEINEPNIPAALVTTKSSDFLSAVSRLSLYGGGDCPELAGLGTYKALSAMPMGGELLTYTDASVKDKDMMSEAIALALSKKIAVSSALSGSCSPYDPLYFELAEATGGQVFIINEKEAGTITKELLEVALSPYLVDVMQVGDSLSGAKSYEFIVDSTTDKLFANISLASGKLNAVSIARPDGSIVALGDDGVNTASISSSAFYNIVNPQTGVWKVNINAEGEVSLSVSANSPLSFESFDFVEYDDSLHPGFFAIDGYPLAGSKVAVKAVLYGDISDARFELRTKSGEIIRSFTLDSFGNYPALKAFLSEDFVTPYEDFLIYAFGKDENGSDFQRVIAKKIVPQTIMVSVVSSGDLPLETKYDLYFSRN
ncbi:MAG: hypothetical protein LBP89_00810 [Helicobacteraceae bacterium]|jgi:hypothetical protein|nr:hypothetical protein [Helicobacteraceae bacterium]